MQFLVNTSAKRRKKSGLENIRIVPRMPKKYRYVASNSFNSFNSINMSSCHVIDWIFIGSQILLPLLLQESNNKCFEESLLNGLKEVIQRQCQKRKADDRRNFEDCFATVLFLTQLLEEVGFFILLPLRKIKSHWHCHSQLLIYDMPINIWCWSRRGYQNIGWSMQYCNLHGRSEAPQEHLQSPSENYFAKFTNYYFQ